MQIQPTVKYYAGIVEKSHTINKCHQPKDPEAIKARCKEYNNSRKGENQTPQSKVQCNQAQGKFSSPTRSENNFIVIDGKAMF